MEASGGLDMNGIVYSLCSEHGYGVISSFYYIASQPTKLPLIFLFIRMFTQDIQMLGLLKINKSAKTFQSKGKRKKHKKTFRFHSVLVNH